MLSVSDAQVVHRQPHKVVVSGDCPIEPVASREVVLTADLAPVLTRLLKAQQAQMNGIQGPDMVNINQGSAMEMVCERSGVPERTMFRILKRESSFVTLDIADKLLHEADGHISMVDVYLEGEARSASVEQAKLIRNLAQCHGYYVAPGSAGARNDIPRLRRKLQRV